MITNAELVQNVIPRLDDVLVYHSLLETLIYSVYHRYHCLQYVFRDVVSMHIAHIQFLINVFATQVTVETLTKLALRCQDVITSIAVQVLHVLKDHRVSNVYVPSVFMEIHS